MRTPTGNDYHWAPEAFPLFVAIHPDMDSRQQLAMSLAAYSWNDLVGSDVFSIYVAPDNFPMWEDNGGFPVPRFISVEEGVAGRDPKSHYKRNAHASVYLKAGISELNGEIHSVKVLLGLHMRDMELFAIMRVCFHELGHALGLTHDINDPLSIMWISATQNPKQDIQQEDIDRVRQQLAGHGESMEIPLEFSL